MLAATCSSPITSISTWRWMSSSGRTVGTTISASPGCGCVTASSRTRSRTTSTAFPRGRGIVASRVSWQRRPPAGRQPPTSSRGSAARSVRASPRALWSPTTSRCGPTHSTCFPLRGWGSASRCPMSTGCAGVLRRGAMMSRGGPTTRSASRNVVVRVRSGQPARNACRRSGCASAIACRRSTSGTGTSRSHRGRRSGISTSSRQCRSANW
ncbi:unannotated protein [freshwater metagenome]|uniref:Unannotated protein n=1 Tax=freshwater metagenome TaxID=449393 RepID=A0A6J6RNH2_9ZZZZ